MYNAESAVEDYVEALRAGDGSTAMALSQGYLADNAPENISTVLLDGEPLAAASAILDDAEIQTTDADIPESFRDVGTTQQVVEIRYHDVEGEPQSTSIVVDQVGTSWLFFHQWQLHPMPLQQIELSPPRCQSMPVANRLPTSTMRPPPGATAPCDARGICTGFH